MSHYKDQREVREMEAYAAGLRMRQSEGDVPKTMWYEVQGSGAVQEFNSMTAEELQGLTDLMVELEGRLDAVLQNEQVMSSAGDEKLMSSAGDEKSVIPAPVSPLAESMRDNYCHVGRLRAQVQSLLIRLEI